ncbi:MULTISPECIES: helix-turn-helix domain-containing protein [unclassified Methylobacterium]|jgi:hypothetical protein|uniref:helix-turn-helix domain-containing protein n=1 Tax=unclassified Methylobacterium TaxID=2615210 RepID=UPI001FEE0234|nr:helix-turn-helix domain-containing protein [Methylobacterium sp. 2A]
MPVAKVTDAEILAAVRAAGNVKAAARALGMARSSIGERFKKLTGAVQANDTEMAFASERGLLGTEPVLPGYAIKRTTAVYGKEGELTREYVTQAKAPGRQGEIPAGHVVKGVSQLRDAMGRVTQEWVKTREGVDPRDVVEAIKAAFEGYEGRHEPIPAPAAASTDLLTLLPLADWHIGAHSWGRETGTDWDLKIAEEVIGRAVETVVERSPASDLGVVLGGGDLMHADNQDNRTARSGNQLDVDGRYPKVFEVASRLTVRTVDAMLRRHRKVVVRILKGNHDEHCAVAIAHFLYAWYRNEPRVTVDLDPSLFWYWRHGRVMLAATHGHETKLQDLPGVMAARRAEDWGLTRFRYAHGFHIHHKRLIGFEAGAVVGESHQAPVAQDAWHHGAGFLSGRSLQTITYHRSYGEVSRAREAILDAQPEGHA